VPRECIDWMDRRNETLYLAVWEDELRKRACDPTRHQRAATNR